MKKLYHISDVVTTKTVTAMQNNAVPGGAVPYVINDKVTEKFRYCQDLTVEKIAAAGVSGMTVKDGILINKKNLFFSNNYSGKMEDIAAGLSGFAGNNPGCIRRAMIPGSICQICFSFVGARINNLAAWTKNDVILSSVRLDRGDVIMDPDMIPETRFSTHGDLLNGLHAYNLMIMAADNPGIQYTLWTKQNGHFQTGRRMFRDMFGTEKPDNMRVIFSASNLDIIPTASGLTALKKCGYDALFAVYSRRAIQDRAVSLYGGHFCKCGPGSCKHDCHFCYDFWTAETWRAYNDAAVLIAEITDGVNHKE